MTHLCETSKHRLVGEFNVPGDKSITHRALMIGSAAEGDSRVVTATLGRDNLATLRIMRQLGVAIEGDLTAQILQLAQDEGLDGFGRSSTEMCELRICGKGFDGLSEPADVLDCGNSGTTARLLSGLLAGRPFCSRLTGDQSLQRRPFKRVSDPLSQMGAEFSGDRLPFCITGSSLAGIDYRSPQASAQVKSAILLAGLQAEGDVRVIEPRRSRDHTERMLSAMGCQLESRAQDDGSWEVFLPDVPGRGCLQPIDVFIPGDFSAAAFFIVAATVVPGSRIRIFNVGFNETRIGLYHVLERMGANLDVENRRCAGGEEVVDLIIESARLRGVDIDPGEVVLAIDEIPVLAAAAAVARGVTRIRGAGELRVKESDRLAMTASLLKSFSCEVEEEQDGLVITGNPDLAQKFEKEGGLTGRDAVWRRSGDHRISMSGAVLEFLVSGSFHLEDTKAVETSFPGFLSVFRKLVDVV